MAYSLQMYLYHNHTQLFSSKYIIIVYWFIIKLLYQRANSAFHNHWLNSSEEENEERTMC